MLVDAACYFGALRESLLAAERSVFLIGWDIDSRTPISNRRQPVNGKPEALRSLLIHLARRKPQLQVHVLLWDYSLLYTLEREPLPVLNLDWRTPPNVTVCLDSALPLGACHHQKIVVVDDSVAYCGGMDLTVRRWDDSNHVPRSRERQDPRGVPYPPFHDVQLAVDGEAALALGALARQRWQAASAHSCPPTEPSGDPWPQSVTPDLTDIDVGIARTLPATTAQTETREIEAMYLHAIAQAETSIYIENQYFTAMNIADAMHRRLLERPRLRALIVLPRTPGGWLERRTMGYRQRECLRRLDGDRLARRIRVVYPWVGADESRQNVTVHSKLIIVDDRFLCAGSANLNRRSMGTDTECNLAIEASSAARRAEIAGLRRRLMAEHLGTNAHELAEREAAGSSLLAVADEPAQATRGLSPLPDGDLSADDLSGAIAEIADPERPVDPIEFIGDMFGASKLRPDYWRVLRLGAVIAAIVGLIFVWHFTPLAEWTQPASIRPWIEALRASVWAGPIVLGVFLLGSLLVFPVTAMIAATAVALGPWSGFLWASIGSMAGALLSYLLGHVIGRRPFESLFGQWIHRIDQRLGNGGIVSVLLMRTLPVAPFTVVNIVAGASSIRLRDYILGTVLGMGPGIAALTLLSDRLHALWEHPTPVQLGFLAGAASLWLGVVVGLQRLSRQLARR